MTDPDAHATPPADLLACHDCDLLQTEPALAPGETARCARCNAILARNPPDSLDRTLALTFTAAVLYLIANLYPLVGLEMQGRRVEVSLFEAVHILWRDGVEPVAALVFVTAQLFPVLELSMILVVLLPLRLGRVSPRLATFFRLVRSVQPWGMVEVFLLGMLVSLVKLSHLATVILGTAFWATAALIVVLTLAARAFDTRLLWQLAPGDEGARP
ncbi:paraquat-inducible protein A [Zoogloea dura]|jgi:paraquat-inducible protein A|uniref:Paraquat-inducible protein A n=1 Tax=Zoogloea dura TaxID=2728840 RepID=A0A848G223_9RHOO|nr:paraquat-inducible protein A [Zoogloea dura]NML25272.1 paraquat-inducible protein A [Zoogloea dura]